MFILFAICDNIEIYLNKFKEIYIDNEILRSDDLHGGNSIKISHLGSSIFKLHEIQPKVFKLIDTTEYFEDKEPSPIRIDIENKVFGLERFAWKFYTFNLILTIALSILIPKMLRRLSNKYLL